MKLIPKILVVAITSWLAFLMLQVIVKEIRMTPEQKHDRSLRLEIELLSGAARGDLMTIEDGRVMVVVRHTNGVMTLNGPKGYLQTNIADLATTMKRYCPKTDDIGHKYLSQEFVRQFTNNM